MLRSCLRDAQPSDTVKVPVSDCRFPTVLRLILSSGNDMLHDFKSSGTMFFPVYVGATAVAGLLSVSAVGLLVGFGTSAALIAASGVKSRAVRSVSAYFIVVELKEISPFQTHRNLLSERYAVQGELLLYWVNLVPVLRLFEGMAKAF